MSRGNSPEVSDPFRLLASAPLVHHVSDRSPLPKLLDSFAHFLYEAWSVVPQSIALRRTGKADEGT